MALLYFCSISLLYTYLFDVHLLTLVGFRRWWRTSTLWDWRTSFCVGSTLTASSGRRLCSSELSSPSPAAVTSSRRARQAFLLTDSNSSLFKMLIVVGILSILLLKWSDCFIFPSIHWTAELSRLTYSARNVFFAITLANWTLWYCMRHSLPFHVPVTRIVIFHLVIPPRNPWTDCGLFSEQARK